MIVVDASVVVKFLKRDEEGYERAVKILGRASRGEKLVVPDLCFVEVANYLATKPEVSIAQVKEGLDIIYGLDLKEEKIDKDTLFQSAQMAKKKGTAVYDMVYAMLAKKLGAKLVTADKNFATKTGFDWVVVV